MQRRNTRHKEVLPRAREHMSLGQHGHRVLLRWRLVPRIPVKLFVQRLSRRRSKCDVALYLVVMDPDRIEASWCGWHLMLHNNAIWVHWHGSWRRLRGSDLVFHQYLERIIGESAAPQARAGFPSAGGSYNTIGVDALRGLQCDRIYIYIYKHLLSKGCAGGSWHGSIECIMTFRMHSLKAIMLLHRPSYVKSCAGGYYRFPLHVSLVTACM